MLNTKTLFPKGFSGKFVGGLFFSWIIVLLFPLFKFIPGPSILFGHPWKVELISSVFLFLILTILLFKKVETREFLEKLSDKNIKTFLLLFLLFIVWSGISAVWAKSWQSVSHHTFIWFSYFTFFTLCLFSIRKSKGIKILFIPTAIASIIISLLSLIDLIGIQDFANNEGIFRMRYAKFAELLIAITPLFWVLVLYSKTYKKSLFFLFTGILTWTGVMLSLSKGAFIAGIFGFLFLFFTTLFFSKTFPRKRIFTLGAIWLSLTLIVQIFFTVGSSLPATTDYISGKEGKKANTSAMRIFTWKIGRQMVSENLIFGVGADNFGIKFNESRISYARENPSDIQNKIGEDFMFERAHNEFIQIFAELGLIGVLIFGLIFFSFCHFFIKSFKENSFKCSPVLLASISGVLAFLISSLFSSFSFRAIQNGLVFFLILAIAANELLKNQKPQNNKIKNQSNLLFSYQKPILAATLLVICFFAISAGKKGLSDYYIYLAEHEKEYSIAKIFYERAVFFEYENASAYLSYGFRTLSEKQPEKAALLFQKSIELGTNTTIIYSYLSTAQILSQDLNSAEKTLAEAVKVFPYSVFARTRYSVLLEENKRTAEADRQLKIARKIDLWQANGWYVFIKFGSEAAAGKARSEENFPALMSLKPLTAMYAVREEEKFSGKPFEKIAINR